MFKRGNTYASLRKGYKHRKSSKIKMSISQIGNKNAIGKHNLSEQTKENIRKGHTKGKNHPMFGKKLPEHIRNKIGARIAYERIDKEIAQFEKQNYRVIPIGRIVPDMIIVRWNWKTNKLEIKAVEVEYGKPDYGKYKKNNFGKRFDGIIWIKR